eukprot:TRINITY_DN3055_c0_g1_i1.p1 TRINITY_DN3055_c0_g1~~TRINITY_DN3055_c0_g1_i1.p1  ORF type:complete len:349 (+),score=73.67 TRINITY_DN3055_c0_g1_i1:64-1110(+)
MSAGAVPIIDIGALTGEDDKAKEEVIEKISGACEEIGFFVITNHGVPKDVIDAAWNETLEFFDLPVEEKIKLKTVDEASYPYGYSPFQGENLAVGKEVEKSERTANDSEAPGDLKEMFAIGPSDGKAEMPPRRLPTSPENFAKAQETYYDHMVELARRLLAASALALGLPADWFKDKDDKHVSALRSNLYPDQTGMKVIPGSIRCSAHTDYGTYTILKSGGPGLQVAKDKGNPEWLDVPFVEDAFIINLGDLMRRWTNEKWASTLHRVINPRSDEASLWGKRLSLAFFHNLNKDALVEPIPTCVSEESPALYDPIVAGDFLMLKHLASNGKADPEAHFAKKIRREGES